VAAKFKDFGYHKVLFVDHDYFSHECFLSTKEPIARA
jgi:hypothetical protein